MIRHDLDDFCTWTYVIVSDLYRELAPDRERPGPRAVCSDAELLTLALIGECCGWHQESEVLSCWQSLRHLFPHRPDRTPLSCISRRHESATASHPPPPRSRPRPAMCD